MLESSIEDPWRAGYARRHDLVEIPVICMCAMFAHVEGFDDIANWAQVKQARLRRFLKVKNGIPSHDTFRRVFGLLGPHAFEAAFRGWVGSVLTAFRQVAVDGKNLRGSADGQGGPQHMVSAFATDLGLTLGQEAVADKSNEITAIPVLLEALAIKGCLVSIDAMATQREIARTIIGRGADYLLAVKNNPPSLCATVEDAFADVPMQGFEQTERSHGRTVVQHAQVIANTGESTPWSGCQCLGHIVSLRAAGDNRPELETRYYSSVRLSSAVKASLAW